ncbi:sulfonate ABC transporter ATP-binding protein [Priestia aryabhattai]|nr:ABC transporter ATP-binding protein [Priestia flexa]MDT2045268.1 ABC transporter ATP-binding protein [Priestia flexa]OZT12163.1 sulfonate ABC transporter ATP-binding protein [Priestia aryabhattai]USY54657.1 ABC transporter ATP-binding protein [Bacillus sp. 1780r2a1]
MSVRLERITKRFVNNNKFTVVLEDVTVDIEQGDFVTLIGPSGCGKSTLLKMIAGLDTDFDGSVKLDGQVVEGPSLKKGMIFQEHRLFPWLTVEENIAADLSLKDKQIRKKVDELIGIVRLQGFEKSYPRELSGGMSQRVAIARALLRNPDVLLLDEPFGALDAFTRTHLQDVLLEIWNQKKTTMIFVTHDLDESIYLANKVMVMSAKPGKVRSIIPIDLPYPRRKADQSFQKMRHRVLKEFEEVGIH